MRKSVQHMTSMVLLLNSQASTPMRLQMVPLLVAADLVVFTNSLPLLEQAELSHRPIYLSSYSGLWVVAQGLGVQVLKTCGGMTSKHPLVYRSWMLARGFRGQSMLPQ